MMNPVKKIAEQFALWDISTLTSWFPSFSGIRSTFRAVGLRFWPQSHPSVEGTVINYELTRGLYRNDNIDYSLGAGFCKPIVDLQVGFIGVPTASTDDQILDTHLNDCMHTYWVDEIQQMFRDAMRDSKCIVRISKPDIFDPLMTIDEAEHAVIEVLPPERVTIERNARNKNIIERAMISHRMVFITSEGDLTSGFDPITQEHEVVEIITRDSVIFWDKNTNSELVGFGGANTYGFVNLLEVHNDWDSSLQGGQSDFESALPFIKAFHDVFKQTLGAHKYHSTPKVKFKIADIFAFIKNNFPDAIDPATGSVKPNSEVNWTGREAIFLQADEDAGFIEARSVLGDSKTLLEFILDCICVASQTPEWAFMRVDSGSANSDRNAQTVPFVKKIDRKRKNFQKPIQDLLKMAQLIYGFTIPVRASLSWESVRPDDNLIQMQSLQQLIMGLEVAVQRGEISDETYRKMLSMFIPVMKSSQQEAIDAKSNVQPQLPAAPAPVKGGPQGKNE